MTGFIKKAVLGVTLAASTLVVAAPAEAQYRRGNRGNGDAAGAAIIGGIIGLGVGAAIASNNNRGRYDDRYYDRGYAYDQGYYDDRYYAPPRRVIVRQRYYQPRVIIRDRNFRGYRRGYNRGYYGY